MEGTKAKAQPESGPKPEQSAAASLYAVPPVEPVAAPPTPQAPPEVSDADFRDTLENMRQVLGVQKVLELLSKHGFNKAGEVPLSDRAAVVAEAQRQTRGAMQ